MSDANEPEETAAAAQDAPGAGTAERVVFFSDAVVAIAITLLALDLRVPDTTNSTTNGQMLHALGAQWPAYLAFIVSFYVIGSHWSEHRRLFRYAAHVNSRISSLNMAWLLMMVLTPFGARLLASNGAFGIRFTIYVLIQVIAVACQVLMSRELHRSRLLRPGAPETTPRVLTSSVVFIVAFLASIPVAFVSRWAFAVWALVPLWARWQQAAQTFTTSRKPRAR